MRKAYEAEKAAHGKVGVATKFAYAVALAESRRRDDLHSAEYLFSGLISLLEPH